MNALRDGWSKLCGLSAHGARLTSPGKSALLSVAIGALIAALAAGLRLIDIGSEPLWLDEGYSWWDAQQTLARLWSLVPRCDPHPPLYFLTLKGWMSEFGDSAQALRALSALFGIATTAVVIFAGREIDRRVGWLAGLLFALTPFQIDYGREARPYALLCFGAALLIFGALRVVRPANSVGRSSVSETADERTGPSLDRGDIVHGWFALFAGGVIVLWTNNTAIFMVIAILAAFGLLLLDRNSRSLLKPLLVCSVLIFALWLPYLPVLLEQAHGVIDDFWIPAPDSWRVAEELSGLIGLNVHDAVRWSAFVVLGGAVLIWRRGNRRASIVVACLIVLPIAFNYVFSVTVRPIFLSRSMIGATPAVVLAMASAVVLISRRWLRHAAITAMLIAHVFALHAWHETAQGNEPWDRIARELAPAKKAGTPGNDELVLLTANELALPLEHALEDLHVSLPVQGAPANFPSPGMSARYPSGKCAPSLLNQDLTALASTIARYKVIYFVTRANNVYDPGNRIVKLLRSIGYTQADEENYAPGSLEVYKFVSRQVSSLPMRSHP